MQNKANAICIPSRKGYISGVYIAKLIGLVGEVDGSRLRPDVREALRQPRDVLETLEFPYEDYLSVLDVVLEGDGMESLGLRFGASFAPRDYGILGYAMLSCSSLRQCLRPFKNYDELFGTMEELDWQFLWNRDALVYRYTVQLEDERLRRFELQTAFGQFMAFRNLIEFPDRFKLHKVTFSFPAPGNVQSYVDVFGLVPEFNSDESELHVAESVLDEPFVMANEDVQRVCEEQCAILARSMSKLEALPLSVRKQILRSPGTVPELTVVAGQLGMSERTLRRRLAEAGTSFQEIVADVRTHLACRYLSETSMAIKEIGYLLGYAEVPNFHRAFKKHLGMTPGEYRESVRGEGVEY